MGRLERGRVYHCREECGRRTGQFSISDKGMTLRLFDYDHFFHVKAGTAVHARIEDSRTISLHDTVSGGIGNSTVLRDKPVTTYEAEVHANTVVVGYQPWDSDDPIRRTWFGIRKAKEIARNPRKLREVARGSLTTRSGGNQLFEVHSRDLTIRCWYAASGSFDLGLNDWWPIFEIDFREPRKIDNYLHEVHRVVRFFSAAAGFQLTPSDICISRFTSDENWRRIEQRLPDDTHDVEYIWHEENIRAYDLHPLNSFVCAFDAREIKTMAACLTAWLNRGLEWEEASTLMMGSLGLHDEISGDRLLMASRWFEKIPCASAEAALDDEALAAITNAAVEEAKARKLAGIANRIRGALKNLKSEASRDRVSRLIDTVNMRFGNTCLDETSVTDLMRAQQLRGATAHGLLDAHEHGSLEVQRGFTALEALAYLLMIKDLPLTPKARRRALASRLVRDYQYAKIAR